MTVPFQVLLILAGATSMPATRPTNRFGPKPTIAEVEALLAAAPPTATDSEARFRAIRSVDALLDTVAVAEDPAIIAFYERRAEAGLKALQAGPPPHHVRVVKFYSSSTVIRSAEGCFAFDFAEGPCGDTWRLPEESTDRFRAFHLTDDQRERLAKVLDVSFITHRHHDHVSFALSDRLARLKKPLIAPPEAKAWFARGKAPFADAIRTPPADTVHTLGPITFVHYAGRQYMEWIDGDPERPVKDSPKTVENHCYLVRLSGMTFAHGGDNREEGVVDWARRWQEGGWRPDVTFALGIGAFTRDLARLWPGRRIPVHDYEFRHDPFNRLSDYLGARPIAALKVQPVLFWGEHLDLLPAP